MEFIILEGSQEFIKNKEDILIIDISKDNERIIYKGEELDYTNEQVKYLYNVFFYKEEKNKKIVPLNNEGDRKEKIISYISQGFYIVRDVLEFLKEINRKQGENIQNIYRGQKVAKWELLPSIHRKRTVKKDLSIEEHEKKLYQNIQKQNLLELRKQDRFINEIVKMQHYGIPSPLLDWSTNPLIALFFATSLGKFDDNKIDGEVDGRVFIVNLKDYTCLRFNQNLYEEYSKFLEKIYKISSEKREESLDNFVFLETINENNRIRAQKGLFSLDISLYKILCFSFEENFMNVFKKIKELDGTEEVASYAQICTYLKETKERNLEANYFLREFINYLENIVGESFLDKELNKKIVDDLKENFKKYAEKLKEIIDIKLEHTLNSNTIIVLEEDKEKIKKELEKIYGIDSYTVYPDLQGYVEYIKENF